MTKNLPSRSSSITPAECFHTFINAIFYIGKGKRSRPYSHLYEALEYHRGDKTSRVRYSVNTTPMLLKELLGHPQKAHVFDPLGPEREHKCGMYDKDLGGSKNIDCLETWTVCQGTGGEGEVGEKTWPVWRSPRTMAIDVRVI